MTNKLPFSGGRSLGAAEDCMNNGLGGVRRVDGGGLDEVALRAGSQHRRASGASSVLGAGGSKRGRRLAGWMLEGEQQCGPPGPVQQSRVPTSRVGLGMATRSRQSSSTDRGRMGRGLWLSKTPG